jgi:sulfite exporter TauE/SafE
VATFDLLPAAAGALVIGASGSFHCLLMCGPLACASAGGPRRVRAALAYHLARVAAYALMGAAFGAAGAGLGRALELPLSRALPWAMALALLYPLLARLVGRTTPARSAPVAQIFRRIPRAAERLAPGQRAALFGAVTPLLPCGLLHGFLATLVATASATGGAALGAAFALGAVPALTMAQLPILSRLPVRLHPLGRILPVVAAGILIYRALGAGSGQPCH